MFILLIHSIKLDRYSYQPVLGGRSARQDNVGG